MTSTLLDFAARGIINPPESILTAGLYEVLMGSNAFGTATPTSDRDVYGFFIPKEIVLPTTTDDNEGRFRQINITIDDGSTMQYDIVSYPVINFFKLCTRGYSQLLEMLFAPDENVLSVCGSTQLVRNARHTFLHEGTVTEFCRFAYVQLKEMIYRERTDGIRGQHIKRYGYDTKAAYHVVRLMLEAYQLRTQGHLNLRDNSQLLLEIRNGQWTEEQVITCVDRLNWKIYSTGYSYLPSQPNLKAIEKLFINCIEAEGAHLGFPSSDVTQCFTAVAA